MTDQLPADSGSPAGTPDANQSASAPVSAQPNSQTPLTADQFRQIAREEADKAMQSTKDRRFQKLEDEQFSQRTLLSRIEEKMNANPAMTLAQAKREAQVDLLLDGSPASPQPATNAPASQGSGTSGAVDVVQGLISKLKMDMNDPQVAQAIREANGDQIAAVANLSDLHATRRSSPEPTEITNSPAGAGLSNSTLSAGEIESKAAELNTLLREPSRNAARIEALQKELGPDFA